MILRDVELQYILDREKKGKKNESQSGKMELLRQHQAERKISSFMKSVIYEIAYRQSLVKYAQKYGVSRASRKYNRARSTIYFWLSRCDGSAESLQPMSRKPHHHPSEHQPWELKLIRNVRRRNPTLELAELWHRLRKRGYTR